MVYMQIKAGTILTSISSNEEDYFDRANVLIVEQNEKGTIGFILNRYYGRKLTDLKEFVQYPAIDLLEGGPMQQDHLYFIHCVEDSSIGGEEIADQIHYGGDLIALLSLMKGGKISSSDIKIFVGYCGWDKGQLEEEIENGGWKYILSKGEKMVENFCFGEDNGRFGV